MDLITFVTDRGANFVKGLQFFRVLYCVAHRLNNILKATFYQQSKKNKKKMKMTPSKTISKIINETEKTPTKMIKKTRTTTKEGSPEIDCYFIEEENHNDSDFTEESSEDEEDDDQLFHIDYATTILDNLSRSAEHILQTIEGCKSLVAYVKKVCMKAYQGFPFTEFLFTG